MPAFPGFLPAALPTLPTTPFFPLPALPLGPIYFPSFSFRQSSSDFLHSPFTLTSSCVSLLPSSSHFTPWKGQRGQHEALVCGLAEPSGCHPGRGPAQRVTSQWEWPLEGAAETCRSYSSWAVCFWFLWTNWAQMTQALKCFLVFVFLVSPRPFLIQLLQCLWTRV